MEKLLSHVFMKEELSEIAQITEIIRREMPSVNLSDPMIDDDGMIHVNGQVASPSIYVIATGETHKFRYYVIIPDNDSYKVIDFTTEILPVFQAYADKNGYTLIEFDCFLYYLLTQLSNNPESDRYVFVNGYCLRIDENSTDECKYKPFHGYNGGAGMDEVIRHGCKPGVEFLYSE